jgi:uncharacterized protein (TIGR03086 family)
VTDPRESVVVLSRALDQAGDVLAAVHEDQLAQPTPCGEWNLAQLVGHLVEAPARFLQMARGEQPDWSAGPRPATSGFLAEFRSNADDLIHHWHQVGESADAGQVDWQIAEIAVHTWDVARATSQARPLLPEVAARGLAFMSTALTAENRGHAFGPAVSVPDDAPVWDRLAAFAGRAVGGRTATSSS